MKVQHVFPAKTKTIQLKKIHITIPFEILSTWSKIGMKKAKTYILEIGVKEKSINIL